MKRKTGTGLLFLTLVVPAKALESFARPQYLANFTSMYGNGSCGTCHVIASGGGQRNSNGMFRQYNINRTFSLNGNRTFGSRNPNRTLPLNSYGTLFENQFNHDTDPSAALIAIEPPPTETVASAKTPETGTGTQSAPGFEIVVSLVGLFACDILARGLNR